MGHTSVLASRLRSFGNIDETLFRLSARRKANGRRTEITWNSSINLSRKVYILLAEDVGNNKEWEAERGYKTYKEQMPCNKEERDIIISNKPFP
jgi:hypothetical protein